VRSSPTEDFRETEEAVTSIEVEEMFAAMRRVPMPVKEPSVVVLHDRQGPGCCGYPPDDGEDVPPPVDGSVLRLPLSRVLTMGCATDAHMVQYDYKPTESGPLSVLRRVNVAILRDPKHAADIPSAGFEMSFVAFDIDEPSNKKWTPEWWSTEVPKVFAMLAVHPGLFIYVTNGGYRIVGTLARPFVLRFASDDAAWKALYQSWRRYLTRSFSIVTDGSCDQWNRFFRVPHPTRDGVLQEHETIGNPRDVGAWSPTLAPEDIVVPGDEAPAKVSTFDPIPVTWDMPLSYLDQRLGGFVSYLEKTAPVVCFVTSAQQPKSRRDAMLGICSVALWKFYLPIDIAGDVIEDVYNKRVVAAGMTAWSRSEAGDYGMSIDERLAAASVKHGKIKPAERYTIQTLEDWEAWEEILAKGAQPDAVNTSTGAVLSVLGLLGARNNDGSREVDCLCGAQGRVTVKGRFVCSRKGCQFRGQKSFLKAVAS